MSVCERKPVFTVTNNKINTIWQQGNLRSENKKILSFEMIETIKNIKK